MQKLNQQAEYILKNFQGSIKLLQPIENDNLIIYVDKAELLDFLKFLKTNSSLSFKILLDLFGADLLGIREPRFEVIYNLLSLKLNCRITVKVAIEDGVLVPSASGVFSTANWLEREVFDMYGIIFENHPDLRRILTDYSFEGHPLRKDFPLSGYKQVKYDQDQKRVVYEPVVLSQEYREFDFESPWEGEWKGQQKPPAPLLPGDEKAT